MLKLFRKLFSSKSKTKIFLGRWGNHGNEIKNIYANHDHCGDLICKNPKEVTEIVQKEINYNNQKNKF